MYYGINPDSPRQTASCILADPDTPLLSVLMGLCPEQESLFPFLPQLKHD